MRTGHRGKTLAVLAMLVCTAPLASAADIAPGKGATPMHGTSAKHTVAPSEAALYAGPVGDEPNIESISCNRNKSGNSSCHVGYSSPWPATVAWSGGVGTPSGDWYFQVCGPSDLYVVVTATVSNGYGSSSAGVVAPCSPIFTG